MDKMGGALAMIRATRGGLGFHLRDFNPFNGIRKSVAGAVQPNTRLKVLLDYYQWYSSMSGPLFAHYFFQIVRLIHHIILMLVINQTNNLNEIRINSSYKGLVYFISGVSRCLNARNGSLAQFYATNHRKPKTS